ncbi:MAG TPA: aminotransferase class I/II-fold pyridoxal phosphate-dependent enzyme [Ignavibacteriales bacterium]|nr:aminotransferase class I/II-fold pyridoxal phosphate-dependent enzyme [Ignavibacteriales bacterium]
MEEIKRLEESALRLEPGFEEREELLKKVTDYSEEFLKKVYSLPAYNFNAGKGEGIYDFPIQDAPLDFSKVLDILKTNVDTPGLNPASRGHLGYIPGGGIFHSALGDFLADVTNRYAGVFFASPGAVRMENMLIRWMADFTGYPDTAAGSLTSGGSIANLMGIVTSRDAHNLKAKDFERSVVYVTSQVHHSVDKALRIAGLKECIQRIIPLDSSWRMKPGSLEEAIVKDKESGLNPWLIIASAGTTDTGAVDPLTEIGDIASKYKLWYHIDAAYGGFFNLCQSGRKALKGIETSDSVIMDPHKGLFIPYGSGAVIVKDRMKLLESHHYEANYMQDALSSTDELAPADLSPELSKHFRGLRLWLPLMTLGVKPFRDSLEEKIQLARYFHEKLAEIKGMARGPYPQLSVDTFRYIPEKGDANEFNRRLVHEIQHDERLFLSSTMLDGKFTLRLAVLSFRTHLDTIDEMLKIIKEKIRLISGS